MNNLLMKKQNMVVSSKKPLIKQITPNKGIINNVYITYNICETCNLNCLFCCINEKSHGKKFISKDNSDKILNEIKEKYGISTIFIMANEPTTQPNLSNHIIKYSIKNNIKIKIVSNGYAPISIYEQMLEGIDADDIDKITISLDSMNEEIHNKLRNNPKSFKNTIKTIQYLKSNNYNLRIQMTICDINYDTIIDSVKILNQEYGINNFAFHCMSVSTRGKINNLKHINPFKWRQLVRKLFNLKKELNNIEEYSIPIIAMTENELLKLYFGGNKELLNKYLNGKSTKMCPALNGNNIYLKATDEEVYLSRCQILYDTENVYSHYYDYSKNTFIKENTLNDYYKITKSQHLCPAIEKEINNSQDYVENEKGEKLYYVCRVLIADEKDLEL